MDSLHAHLDALLAPDTSSLPHHHHILHRSHQPLPGSVWERHSNLQLACMVISIFFWIFSFTAAFAAIAISRSRYAGHKRSMSSRMAKEDAPGVSIIRPLRGIDCNMYENLASSFRQDYPKFEIIFSVAQPNDPALAVVRDLMKKYPTVDARIIIGEKVVGINPKINNMIQSYETAKYDIVWVCDSNVYVDRGCMGRSIDKMMQPGVGLVHHLPFGVRPKTLGSELELMFLDTVHAKMYLFINWTGLASCVVGKSNLYRRSDLDKVGGMAAFGKYMAEDNLVATAIFNMGYKHAMTSDLAYQSLGSMTPSDYFLRRARWTRIRKYTVTAATIVEPFIEMIGCGLVASYGFNLLWQIHFLNFLAFHVVAWFLVDLTVYQALSGQTMDNLQGFLMAWSLRELAALPLFAYAVAGSTVDWRDQTFLLLRDGTVKPLVAPSPAKVTPSSSSASSSPSSSSSSSRSSSSASISATGSIPSSPTTTAAATLSTPPSPSVAAFWSKANNVMPPSTQATVRKFLRHPTVISIVRSTLAIIHFVVDILMKSQRNGNDYEAQVTMDPTVDSELLLDEQSDDGHVVKNSGVDPIVMLKKVPLAKKLKNRKYHHANTRSSSYSYDGDDSSAAESDAIVETRRQTIDRRASGLQHSHSGSEEETRTKVVDHDLWTLDADQIQPGDRTIFYSTVKSETEAEHGRRSTEEDALSKAMEPYLSDSLSRRGRTRHEIPSASQFLSV